MPKEFDAMVSAIKAQLKKANPTWKEDKINSSAYAIATKNWEKSHGGKSPTESVKKDENGMFIVGENIKLILESTIDSTNIIEE